VRSSRYDMRPGAIRKHPHRRSRKLNLDPPEETLVAIRRVLFGVQRILRRKGERCHDGES